MVAVARSRRQIILAIVRTDRTFERADRLGRAVWVGKCIHCNAKLVIRDDGEPLGEATIEHILPRSHGGGEECENLALACARCNAEKGIRHDWRHGTSERAQEIATRLLARRRERWREPVD